VEERFCGRGYTSNGYQLYSYSHIRAILDDIPSVVYTPSSWRLGWSSVTRRPKACGPISGLYETWDIPASPGFTLRQNPSSNLLGLLVVKHVEYLLGPTILDCNRSICNGTAHVLVSTSNSRNTSLNAALACHIPNILLVVHYVSMLAYRWRIFVGL